MNHPNNLLTDPVLPVRDSLGRKHVLTLPQTLALASEGRIASFTTARRHQRHPLKAFLVQLAVIACQRAGLTAPPRSPGGWQKLLRDLTSESKDPDAPWTLVSPDLDQPAFLQPPRDQTSTRILSSPDDIDIPIHSRQFEPRTRTDRPAPPDAWIYALISIQTHGGFLGTGNHGNARMGGGFGSRPHTALTTSPVLSEQIERDVRILLADGRHCSSDPALLWTVPWNGNKSESLEPNSVHPLCIEVARIIRLRADENVISASPRPAASPRIKGTGEISGSITDLWDPRSKRTGSPLTVDDAGFSRGLIDSLLTRPDVWELPILALPTDEEAANTEDSPLYLSASALSRGRGRTSGYHEAYAPVPASVITSLRSDRPTPESMRSSGEHSRALRALRTAAVAYLAGGMNRQSDAAKRLASEIAPRIYDAGRSPGVPAAHSARQALERIIENHAPSALDRHGSAAVARSLLEAGLH